MYSAPSRWDSAHITYSTETATSVLPNVLTVTSAIERRLWRAAPALLRLLIAGPIHGELVRTPHTSSTPRVDDCDTISAHMNE